jgi:hypothetical protein
VFQEFTAQNRLKRTTKMAIHRSGPPLLHYKADFSSFPPEFRCVPYVTADFDIGFAPSHSDIFQGAIIQLG